MLMCNEGWAQLANDAKCKFPLEICCVFPVFREKKILSLFVSTSFLMISIEGVED